MKNGIMALFFVVISFNVFSQQSQSFKANDSEALFYTIFGEGAKVVILYGGPGYGCKTIFDWSKIIKNRQLIFFDQRGTGLSKNVRQDTSTINLRTSVSDIESLRQHLKEDKLVIIGYSWGAALAMAYAASYPDKVANLVLISPMGPDLSYNTEMFYNILSRRSKEERDSLNYWFQKDVIEKDEITAYKNQVFYTYIPYFFNHEKGEQLLWNLINNADFNATMFNLMWQDLNKIKFDVKENLKKYNGKCTIIRGQQDVISYKVIVQIKDILPQVLINEMAACGHFVDLEIPDSFPYLINSGLK